MRNTFYVLLLGNISTVLAMICFWYVLFIRFSILGIFSQNSGSLLFEVLGLMFFIIETCLMCGFRLEFQN